MTWFNRAAKVAAHPRLERQLRAGKFAGLDPEQVEDYLDPKPVHFYDVWDQPEWVKRARQWAYEAQLPEAVYPIHLWSAGLGGGIRSPMTWFKCKGCGKTELGSPDALPDRGCWGCAFANEEAVGWEVADLGAAYDSTVKACDGKSDLIARTWGTGLASR